MPSGGPGAEIKTTNNYVYADIGARISVREFGGSAAARTYIQVLDTIKYNKVIQRLVLDTVLDFLSEKGVDTSAYQESASAIITNSYPGPRQRGCYGDRKPWAGERAR